MGYPSAIKILAEKQQKKELSIDPYIIQVSGEPFYLEDKRLVESTFSNAEILNFYCSTEHLVIGFGRDNFNGLYLFEDDLIFEIDESNLIITNLLIVMK